MKKKKKFPLPPKSYFKTVNIHPCIFIIILLIRVVVGEVVGVHLGPAEDIPKQTLTIPGLVEVAIEHVVGIYLRPAEDIPKN